MLRKFYKKKAYLEEAIQQNKNKTFIKLQLLKSLKKKGDTHMRSVSVIKPAVIFEDLRGRLPKISAKQLPMFITPNKKRAISKTPICISTPCEEIPANIRRYMVSACDIYQSALDKLSIDQIINRRCVCLHAKCYS